MCYILQILIVIIQNKEGITTTTTIKHVVFLLGPIPENKNTESAESFIKLLHSLSVIFID